jgi:hypothetical protein
MGFEHGFLKLKENEGEHKVCFDDKTSEKLMNVIQAVVKLQIFKIQQLFPDILVVVHALETCNVEKFKPVIEFCYADSSRCAPAQLMANIQKNMFVLMGKLTDLGQIVRTYPPTDATAMYDQTYQIADDLGSLLRVVIGFDQQKEETKKPKHFF